MEGGINKFWGILSRLLDNTKERGPQGTPFHPSGHNRSQPKKLPCFLTLNLVPGPPLDFLRRPPRCAGFTGGSPLDDCPPKQIFKPAGGGSGKPPFSSSSFFFFFLLNLKSSSLGTHSHKKTHDVTSNLNRLSIPFVHNNLLPGSLTPIQENQVTRVMLSPLYLKY